MIAGEGGAGLETVNPRRPLQVTFMSVDRWGAVSSTPARVPGDRGCNSAAQVKTYLQRRFGEGRRMLHLQTSTLDGLYVFAGRGGGCLA